MSRKFRLKLILKVVCIQTRVIRKIMSVSIVAERKILCTLSKENMLLRGLEKLLLSKSKLLNAFLSWNKYKCKKSGFYVVKLKLKG